MFLASFWLFLIVFSFHLSSWTANRYRFLKVLTRGCKFTVLLYHGCSLSIVTLLSCKLAVSLEVSSKVMQFCCVKTRPWSTDSWTPRRKIHTKLRCEIRISYTVLIPLGGHRVNSNCKVIWSTFEITGCLQESCATWAYPVLDSYSSVCFCICLTHMWFIIGSWPGADTDCLW